MKTNIRTHAFISDGIADHRGRPYCCICGLIEVHPCHELPKQPAEADERDAAVLGESNEEN